jgi:hypothetical protein
VVRYNEQGFIVELDPTDIFVFGSNLAGRHGAGAAKQAAEQFGAQYGVGEGLTGMCYAFPTLDEKLQQLPWERLELARNRFVMTARENPHLWFLLTKVGTGLAGYNEQEIISLFFNVPENVVRPKGWL